MISDEEYHKLRVDPGAIVFDECPASSTEQITQGAILEDEDSLEDSSLYHDHPVDRLWKFCDFVESSVKLLLPDSQLVPYYLRKPRHSKEKSMRNAEREKRVFDIFVQKEIENSKNQKVAVTKVPKTSILSLREERIGRELIFEYRQDPEKLMNLLKKYDEHELKRKKARQRSQSVAVKPPVDVLIPPVVPAVVNVDEGEDEENLESQDEVPDLALQNAASVLDKMERVLCRRTTLRNEKDKENQRVVQKWEARVADLSSRRVSNVGIGESVKITPLAIIDRQDKWIKVILGIRAIQRMKDTIEEFRKEKEEERKRWFAFRLIQKFIRKARKLRRRRHLAALGILVDDDEIISEQGEDSQASIPMLRRSMAGAEELLLYHKRVEAASLLISFLKICSKQYRSIMHQYFRKVLVIQRRAREQLIANEGRYLLLSAHFDKVLPAFMAYLAMVLSGKGNDLKNLTSLDASRVRIHTRHMKNHRIVDMFDSPSFHAFLRENKGLFQQSARYLGHGRNAMCCQMVNIDRIKRHVLLSLLFRKRYQFATRLESFKPVAIPAQTISRKDVLAFIRGERDPVVDYLNEVKRIEDEHKAKYYATKEASKHGRVYRKYTGHELCLSLLSQITAEEYAMAVLNITEIAAIEYEKITSVRTNPGSANMMGLNGKGNNVVVVPIPTVPPSFGNNLSVIAMFLPRIFGENANTARSSVGSRQTFSMEENMGKSVTSNLVPETRSNAEDAEIKRMMQDTARRVEQQALNQQRKELVQATRRGSMMSPGRRSSLLNVANSNSPIASAAAAALRAANAGSGTNSPMASTVSFSPAATAVGNNRPGRRLSQITSLPPNTTTSTSTIPRKPEDRRRSIAFRSAAAATANIDSNFHKVHKVYI